MSQINIFYNITFMSLGGLFILPGRELFFFVENYFCYRQDYGVLKEI
jgi:hypothetical protein